MHNELTLEQREFLQLLRADIERGRTEAIEFAKSLSLTEVAEMMDVDVLEVFAAITNLRITELEV